MKEPTDTVLPAAINKSNSANNFHSLSERLNFPPLQNLPQSDSTKCVHFKCRYLERNIVTRFRRSEAGHVGDRRKHIHQLHHVFYDSGIWEEGGSAS